MNGALDLGAARLSPLILRAGLPAMAGLSLNALHQGVDAIWIGLLSTEAVAAIALALPLLAVSSAIGVGLGSGAAALAGQALGAGRPRAAGAVVSAVLALALPVAALASVSLFLAREPVLALLGAPPALVPAASEYLAIMALCAGLGIVQILADFVAIGEGNAGLSLRMLALCFGLNMALDPVAIFWLGWGLEGAAAATVVAQVVTLGVYARHFLGGRGPVVLARAGWSLRDAGRAMRIGLPEAGWNMLSGLAFVMATRAAAQHGGANETVALAAAGIALRFAVMVQLPFAGFCLGARAVLAHAHGAGDPERFRRAERRIAALCAGPAILAWVIVLLAAERVASAFTEDPAVVSEAALMLRIVILPLPLLAAFLARLNALQAQGRSAQAMALGMAPSGYLLIPLLIALPPVAGLAGVAGSVALAAAAPGLWAAVALLLSSNRSVSMEPAG